MAVAQRRRIGQRTSNFLIEIELRVDWLQVAYSNGGALASSDDRAGRKDQ